MVTRAWRCGEEGGKEHEKEANWVRRVLLRVEGTLMLELVGRRARVASERDMVEREGVGHYCKEKPVH